uniref:Uncharacterized protein n=1 Tax=[Tolypothrix] sp. PCC 7415 TaxID=373957 RepID=A0A2P0ZGB2_9CYAN|nr:hypothetical protein [[Tolypothrix] sp. PCC 7415]
MPLPSVAFFFQIGISCVYPSLRQRLRRTGTLFSCKDALRGHDISCQRSLSFDCVEIEFRLRSTAAKSRSTTVC